MDIQGKISYKTQNGKAIKLEGSDKYYNAYKKEDLDSFSVGQIVKIVYETKGNFQNISTIELVPEEKPKTAAPQTNTQPKTTGFHCVDCGKELPDGKYKKCYDCNQKAKQSPAQTTENEPEVFLCEKCGAKMKNNKYKTCFACSKKGGFRGGKNNYNSPERDAQIRRGNAINAAAATISGNMAGADPETLKQALLYIAEAALTWLDEKNK